MRPHELVKRMLNDRKLSTYAAAKAMHKTSFQPTLHKFLAGDVASPEHSTAERICNYLSLPLEAIYDAKVATRVARELGFITTSYKPPEPTAPRATEPVPIADYQSNRPNALPAELLFRIEKLSNSQLAGLAQLIIVYLDQVAPLQATTSKRKQG